MGSAGKYEIICPLQAQAPQRNYLAFLQGVGGFRRLVVLRVLYEGLIADDSIPSRLLGPARSCATFSHPFIASTFEPQVLDGRLYLVIEFAAGATLAELAEACRANKQRLPLGLVLRAGRDAAYALHYAHTYVDPVGRRKPVVHGAFGDRSLLVTYEGTSKVVDLAYPREPVPPDQPLASPEQLRGEELDGRADLYSLAAVLRVHLGRGPGANMGGPSGLHAEAGVQMDALLAKALSADKEARHATALEFARDLEKVAAKLLYSPDQSGAVVQKLFASRREQLKTLVTREEAESGTRPGGPLPAEALAALGSDVGLEPTRPHQVPTITSALPPGPLEAPRTVHLRRPRSLTGLVVPDGGSPPPVASEEVTAGGQQPLPEAAPQPEEDPQTVQMALPAWMPPITGGGFHRAVAPTVRREAPADPLSREPDPVPPASRFDVVPPEAMAPPLARRSTGPAQQALGEGEASPSAEFRASLFEDLPASEKMARPARQVPPSRKSAAHPPPPADLDEEPRKDTVRNVGLIAVALLVLAGAAAWVLEPDAVRSGVGQVRGLFGRAPDLQALAEADGGTQAPDASVALAEAELDGGATDEAQAEETVDAGAPANPVKPAKASKPAGKKKKRRSR